MPPKSEIIPQLSSIYAADPGTHLSFKVGTNIETASIDSSLDVSAGGNFILGTGTAGTGMLNPATYTGSYVACLSCASASGVTGGTPITVRLAYSML